MSVMTHEPSTDEPVRQGVPPGDTNGTQVPSEPAFGPSPP